MNASLLQLFEQYPGWAVVLSLLISVLVAVIGVLPSVFITAANILFFGFWNGVALSFAGEALGAGIAFLLYRAGFKKKLLGPLQRYPKATRLVEAEGAAASGLVFTLRLLPFVPSGLVTLAAAIGRISFLRFLIASSLGKIPALLLEAYSVQQVTEFTWVGKGILLLVGVLGVWWLVRRK
ncbi:MAG TPA: VTT domain-containing protein [Chitinophagaceae bacterium]|nr:VTT domain-containing protein [Chitinophagaceae bacterium]